MAQAQPQAYLHLSSPLILINNMAKRQERRSGAVATISKQEREKAAGAARPVPDLSPRGSAGIPALNKQSRWLPRACSLPGKGGGDGILVMTPVQAQPSGVHSHLTLMGPQAGVPEAPVTAVVWQAKQNAASFRPPVKESNA